MVNYLVHILLSKNIPKIVVHLYFDSYMRQKACVSWDNIKTSYFSMCIGVKQGGVISSFVLVYTLILCY